MIKETMKENETVKSSSREMVVLKVHFVADVLVRV